ncbi:MAG: DHH family phosphoesterase [Candidatus Paceibacterota bacterium]
MLTANEKQIGQDILNEIKQAENILLHLHPNPDPDSIGSALAIAEVCLGLGKKVTIISGDSPLPESLSFLPGFNDIKVVTWAELDLTPFDLLIAGDSGSPEMVSRQIDVTKTDGLKIVVIDHHETNSLYGHINLVVKAPATAQILFDLFSLWPVDITPNVAVNLFVALYADTGGFKYDYIDSHTFVAASQLLEINHKVLLAVRTMQMQATPGSLTYKALAYANISTCAGDKAALTTISLNELEAKNISKRDTENVSLSNDMLAVSIWQVVAILTETEDGGVKISLRSKDATLCDVSKIANVFGGGGHKAAAGAKLMLTLEEAKEKVITEIEKYLQ